MPPTPHHPTPPHTTPHHPTPHTHTPPHTTHPTPTPHHPTKRSPSSGAGNRRSSANSEDPNSRPSASLIRPRKMGAAPLRAPNRACAARPPAPWQHGMAPNQQPTRFMAPTEKATAVHVRAAQIIVDNCWPCEVGAGCAAVCKCATHARMHCTPGRALPRRHRKGSPPSGEVRFSGNSSRASWVTEMTELKDVSASCGSPARRRPAARGQKGGTCSREVGVAAPHGRTSPWQPRRCALLCRARRRRCRCSGAAPTFPSTPAPRDATCAGPPRRPPASLTNAPVLC